MWSQNQSINNKYYMVSIIEHGDLLQQKIFSNLKKFEKNIER